METTMQTVNPRPPKRMRELLIQSQEGITQCSKSRVGFSLGQAPGIVEDLWIYQRERLSVMQWDRCCSMPLQVNRFILKVS